MIIETFINMAVDFFVSLFSNWKFDVAQFSYSIDKAFEIMAMIFYILPMPVVVFVITVQLSLQSLRLVIAIFRAVWSVIPFT